MALVRSFPPREVCFIHFNDASQGILAVIAGFPDPLLKESGAFLCGARLPGSLNKQSTDDYTNAANRAFRYHGHGRHAGISITVRPFASLLP